MRVDEDEICGSVPRGGKQMAGNPNKIYRSMNLPSFFKGVGFQLLAMECIYIYLYLHIVYIYVYNYITYNYQLIPY